MISPMNSPKLEQPDEQTKKQWKIFLALTLLCCVLLSLFVVCFLEYEEAIQLANEYLNEIENLKSYIATNGSDGLRAQLEAAQRTIVLLQNTYENAVCLCKIPNELGCVIQTCGTCGTAQVDLGECGTFGR